jgi:hypothetical protein
MLAAVTQERLTAETPRTPNRQKKEVDDRRLVSQGGELFFLVFITA